MFCFICRIPLKPYSVVFLLKGQISSNWQNFFLFLPFKKLILALLTLTCFKGNYVMHYNGTIKYFLIVLSSLDSWIVNGYKHKPWFFLVFFSLHHFRCGFHSTKFAIFENKLFWKDESSGGDPLNLVANCFSARTRCVDISDAFSWLQRPNIKSGQGPRPLGNSYI